MPDNTNLILRLVFDNPSNVKLFIQPYFFMFHMIVDHIASRGHAGYSAYIIKKNIWLQLQLEKKYDALSAFQWKNGSFHNFD